MLRSFTVVNAALSSCIFVSLRITGQPVQGLLVRLLVTICHALQKALCVLFVCPVVLNLEIVNSGRPQHLVVHLEQNWFATLTRALPRHTRHTIFPAVLSPCRQALGFSKSKLLESLILRCGDCHPLDALTPLCPRTIQHLWVTPRRVTSGVVLLESVVSLPGSQIMFTLISGNGGLMQRPTVWRSTESTASSFSHTRCHALPSEDR